MLGRQRAQWKQVKYFAEYYDLSKAQAYRLLKMPGFPYIKTGSMNYKVDMNKTDEWFEMYFGR